MSLTFVQWLRSSLGPFHVFLVAVGSLVLAGQVLHAGSYSAAVLSTPGLQGYWQLGEASGSFADSGPHGLNGIGMGSAMSRAVPGPRPADGFLGFEATNTAIGVDRTLGASWVNIADDDRLDPRTGDWAIEAWFYNDGQNPNQFTWAIAGKLQSGGTDNGRLGYTLLFNYWNHDETVVGSYRREFGQTLVETLSPGISVSTPGWNHMVSVLHRNRTAADADYQQSGVSVFINGELKNTRASTLFDGDPGFDINNSHGLAIGALTQSGNQGFRGLIDEVAVFNRALSPDEVAAHYQAAFTPFTPPPPVPDDHHPAWAGQGAYRLLVEVDPISIGSRPFDERPAQLTIDWQSALQSQLGLAGKKADINSIQVIQYNPETGQPVAEGGWAYGKSAADRPFRWYDDDIPNPYPEFEGRLSSTPNGTLSPIDQPNGGYFLDVEGNWDQGRLAWSHVQNGGQPSHYAVYFDVLPADTVPHQASPRGFLGDGGMRTQEVGATTNGLLATRIDVTDWDGDGLVDIVAGNQRGAIAVYKNLGTPTEPSFDASKLVATTDGNPIDIGWNSTPLVVDFDGDGIDDLLTGGQSNRVAWFKNVGTNTNRQFEYQGLVRTSSDQALALPTTPNPERPTITGEYYPVLDMVDLYGTGQPDLFAGGYITGQIYHYKNVGARADGTPLLELQGPLYADGVPIDTEWAAAPTFADFNGDGTLDIVTGTFAVGSGVTADKFLQYYVNVGTPFEPSFEERPFPKVGQFPVSALGTPRTVDFNNDGLLDLIVSADTTTLLYKNIGTATEPLWDASVSWLHGDWGSAPLSAGQIIDWNNDGRLDLIYGTSVSLNLGQGNPGVYGGRIPIMPSGQSIPPKPGDGDGWQWLRLFDLTGNGEIDILDADHDGKIWLHRNLGTSSSPNFDTTGVVFMQTNGEPIDVGPGPNDAPFNILQGSRATYAVEDFNGDGRPDLVVVNYAGVVRYYENEMASPNDDPLFTLPNVVGQLTGRGVPFAGDWDGDGQLDILASSDTGQMLFFQNIGNDANGQATFASGEFVELLNAPGASVGLNVVDFNQDGDADVLVDTSHRFTVFTDGSFLQHGYAVSTLLGIESFAAGIPGDFNGDGHVDGRDFLLWQRDTTVGDLADWQANYGATASQAATSAAVPEPGGLALMLTAACGLTIRRNRTATKNAKGHNGLSR